MHPLELPAHDAPGLVGARLDEPDEEQGQPAEQDVRADALLLAVVHRAQVERRLSMTRNPPHHWRPRWGQIRVSYPQPAEVGPVDGLIDRLGAQPAVRSVGVPGPQAAGHLLGTPCQWPCESPHPWPWEVPAPGWSQGLGWRPPPLERASRIRKLSPSVTTTTAWWRSRSSSETAVVCSGRNLPQDSNGQWDATPRLRRS